MTRGTQLKVVVFGEPSASLRILQVRNGITLNLLTERALGSTGLLAMMMAHLRGARRRIVDTEVEQGIMRLKILRLTLFWVRMKTLAVKQ